MVANIPNGVWPTMVTPFTDAGQVDYRALEQLIEWYIGQGVHGLFAVCQSSEMFYLTLEERVGIARFVVDQAAGRVPVIASGHVSDGFDAQAEELQQIAGTGVKAVVLVSNRLAASDESDSVWFDRVLKLIDRVPDVPMGIYECPYPYKRLLSPQLLKQCAETGRFAFLKDTSCDLQQIAAKLQAVAGTPLKLYNANSATLLASLRLGAAGFSGVMANFHPDLYVRLTEKWREEPQAADMLQSFVGAASLVELQMYPVNAKYHLGKRGLPFSLYTRSKDAGAFRDNHKLEVEQLDALYELVKKQLS
ncbi:dihydrodipicolinate synthase family protein [Paenibacillus sp. GCM10023248]|uniref:dihydrodipicolinate synthase family protein n=1 Tax=unclassified Paenibacillus TaxID=185978 RepID=UPI002378E9AB|nr:dihydrodipicolinate synthase family protein [Paenibacillus sp. MAHUQ-63]MDD9269192.1 dihydrodipicolinate synthase family protein [Paenibacillus sp. MAHUQ-63]